MCSRVPQLPDVSSLPWLTTESPQQCVCSGWCVPRRPPQTPVGLQGEGLDLCASDPPCGYLPPCWVTQLRTTPCHIFVLSPKLLQPSPPVHHPQPPALSPSPRLRSWACEQNPLSPSLRILLRSCGIFKSLFVGHWRLVITEENAVPL